MSDVSCLTKRPQPSPQMRPMRRVIRCLAAPLAPCLALGLALGALAPVPGTGGEAQAQAGMRCGERQAIVAELARRYGETRRSYGLAPSQGVFEVFASEGGTWTILLTRPGGMACLMAAGQAFEAEKPGPPEEPA